ncbi:MAG: Maf family protein [Lentisphaerota bacterium]
MIILASTSPRRIEIFKRLGFSFIAVPPDFDESSMQGLEPYSMPLIFAQKKAESLSLRFKADVVIGFDTLVFHNGKILGKPKDLNEAKNFFFELSGNYHEVITGCSIVSLELKIFKTFSDTSKVKFKNLTRQIIDEYLLKVNTLDKAGAYAVQEYGEMIIEHTEGSIDNIIGLPTEKLLEEMKNLSLICC